MPTSKEATQISYDLLESTSRRKIHLRQWPFAIGAAVLLLSGAAAVALIQRTSLPGKKVSVPAVAPASVLTVTVQPASVRQIDRVITVNGSISAWDPISVGAEASGLAVTSILVDEGTTVTKGQILATLNASLIKPQLESEEARLKASLASARKAVQPNRPEDINGLSAAVSQAKSSVQDQEAALVQAQANLLNAMQNEKRYQFLQKQGAVSLQELETRQTTAKVAAANVLSAEEKINAAQFSLRQSQERLAMAKSGGRAEDIQIAAANIAEIRGNIKRFEAQIAQTIVRAPVDGMITRRDAHIGDISTAGKTMFSMSRDSRLELKAQVPAGDLAAVSPGQAVTITSSLTGDQGISGQVREISPLVDSDTRLATVRIDIPTTAAVKPGMYAEGTIAAGRYAALTVPAQAVIGQDDKSCVFILNHNRVESRLITVGARTSDLIEVTSGLHANERVVIKGAGFLKDGDYVSVATELEPAAGSR